MMKTVFFHQNRPAVTSTINDETSVFFLHPDSYAIASAVNDETCVYDITTAVP